MKMPVKPGSEEVSREHAGDEGEAYAADLPYRLEGLPSPDVFFFFLPWACLGHSMVSSCGIISPVGYNVNFLPKFVILFDFGFSKFVVFQYMLGRVEPCAWRRIKTLLASASKSAYI